MRESIKIAIRRQKKLIILFFLTIFLPSVALSIFGIVAMRNERFRLDKQFRENQLNRISFIKSEINQEMTELENELKSLVRSTSFIHNDTPEIKDLVKEYLEKNPLSGQFFVVHDQNEPWFPLFLPDIQEFSSGPPHEFTGLKRQKSDLADNLEFSQKNYTGAISILEDLLKTTGDKNLRGQVLNRIARNYMKQKNFNAAISAYSEIINNFPESRTSSGGLLSVTVHLQLVDCYLQSGRKEEAIEETLKAFKAALNNYYNLSENQFVSSISSARQEFIDIRNENPEIVSSAPGFLNDFDSLDRVFQKRSREWKIINDLKNECIPDIYLKIVQNNYYSEKAFRYSKITGTDDFLVLATLIPDQKNMMASGFAGIMINNTYLEDSLLPVIISGSGLKNPADVTLSDPGGRIIIGDSALSGRLANITSYFDDTFPPWRLEMPGEITRPLLIKGFYKSFYFWTILTMMLILVFGIVITGRTIAHEKEVLKLKSDFVSSVSHEFKTPITSIKALTERLLEGTVNDPKRMKEYYSVISKETENLSHLVGNFLDFSKMEEGKKQYHFEETDPGKWLDQTVNAFLGRIPQGKYKLKLVIADNLPPVNIDKNSMKLAVNNLLDNAVKFSSENPVITITLEKLDGWILIKVRDNGVGISKDEQSRIFEKFYRGNDAHDISSTGTGLGLTIVKQVVEAHGGTIDVESEVGKGSMFTVRIPLDGN